MGGTRPPVADRLGTKTSHETFVWPLFGAHRHLVEEKERLLEENCLRFEAAAVELGQRMASGEQAGAVTGSVAFLPGAGSLATLPTHCDVKPV